MGWKSASSVVGLCVVRLIAQRPSLRVATIPVRISNESMGWKSASSVICLCIVRLIAQRPSLRVAIIPVRISNESQSHGEFEGLD